MVQPNAERENSLKQPVGCKTNPCEKQVLGVKFTVFRKHIKIFSLLFTTGAELSFFSLHPPFAFLTETHKHNLVSPFDLVPIAAVTSHWPVSL